MRAGRLRHRLTIQKKPDVIPQNSFGEEDFDWEDLDTVWGSIEPLRGREFVEMQQAGAEATTRIVIRYRDDVGPAIRVVWGSHTYDVLAAIEVEGRRRELQLMCRELL